MTEVAAARFEDRATRQGSDGILCGVSDFVAAYGVGAGDRDQIAGTLAAVLDAAAGHANLRDDARISVIADVMPGDVQIVLSLSAPRCASSPDLADAVGGLEMWISFPRDGSRRVWAERPA